MSAKVHAQRLGGYSYREEWLTPMSLFLELDREFGFDLDPCACAGRLLCPENLTVDDDGLSALWAPRRVFMNPPYGRGLERWVAKARAESEAGALVVGLLPARTDVAWWHDHVEGRAQTRFIRGRLAFGGNRRSGAAPFPSVVVIWHRTDRRSTEGGGP